MVGKQIDIVRALDIHGWMEPDELTWLAERASTSALVVEIGSWKGRSTRAIADHVGTRLFVVDPWVPAPEAERTDLASDNMLWFGGQAVYRKWCGHLRDHLDAGRVVPYPMRSQRAIRFLSIYPGPASVDVVFIDGDHDGAAVARDIELYRPLVRPGGLLAGHDYTTGAHPGVRRAVDEAFGASVKLGPGSIWSVTV